MTMEDNTMKLKEMFEANDFQSTKEVWLNKGAVFLYEGDAASSSCYLIKSGSLDVRLISGSGHETLLYHLLAGDLVGELAMFDSNIRKATVVAGTKTCLLEIESSEFKKNMNNLAFMEKLSGHFLSRYLKTHEVVCRLSQPNIGAKLCHYFLTLAEQTSSGDLDSGQVAITLPSHAMISKLLSCQRESVTREIKKLIKANVLKKSQAGYLLDMVNVNLYLGDVL